jgi:hypothetical protein
MFELAKQLIEKDGFASLTVTNTFVSIKKIHNGEVSLQLEFNWSNNQFFAPDYRFLNSAERWREWRGNDAAYRSVFCKIIYCGEVPAVDNLKKITARGRIAIGEITIGQDDRTASSYKCAPHTDFILVEKGRKAEPLTIKIDENINILF